MSMTGLRFATHYSGDASKPVAEVPPYWLQVLDPGYDEKARNDFEADSSSGNWDYSGNWVGTDSFISPFDVDDMDKELIAMDHAFAMRNPYYLHSDLNTGLPVESETRECPLEVVKSGANERYILLFDPTVMPDIVHCDALEDNLTDGVLWDNRVAFLGDDPNYLLDGHFGDKRWHYYDGYNFDLPVPEADIDVLSSRGTGGSIVVNKKDLGAGDDKFDVVTGLDPHGDGDEPWYGADTFSNFFERLFYYDYWNEDHSALLTVPPYHEPADDSESAYHVRLFTNMYFDDSAHVSDDGAVIAANAELFDPDEYGSIDFISFFKLWVVRDKRRDNFGDSASGNPITSTFDGNHTLQDWKGNDIVGVSTDLHPIWARPLEGETITRTLITGGVAANATINVEDTSFWRRDFLKDWHGRNSVKHSTYQMGALAWPVPYLAYQRGDHDYFPDADRGDEDKTIPPIFHEYDHYTKFILYALGTVRVPDETLLDQNRDRKNQAMSDFKVVSRSLYRMVFYMETRAPDTIDDEKVSKPKDTGYDMGDNFIGAFDYQDVYDCNEKPVLPLGGYVQQNQMNWAFFNSRFIPICDIQPTKDASRKRFFEPRGIYMRSIEKVPYRDSAI
jgi:hypothetical protein